MEMCPTVSPSALFPTIIRRDGKWITAVPIAISYGVSETDTTTRPRRGLWVMLKNAVAASRKLSAR